MTQRSIVFIVDLVQDVAICAPIMRLAARIGAAPIHVFVSAEFSKRDNAGIWTLELTALAAETNAALHSFINVADALPTLRRLSGVLFAPSESCLPAHAAVNAVVVAVQDRFRTVAVQHGFENIGLLHHESHDKSFGPTVRFGSQILLAWFAAERLTSLSPHERSKIYIAGPPQLIDQPALRYEPPLVPHDAILICENLHSVRMREPAIIETFLSNVARMVNDPARSVQLRPHPSRHFLSRNPEALARCTINDAPLYKQDLGSFDLAISAPSSIVLDLALAGVPIGVWNAGGTRSSAVNYAGLTILDQKANWSQFADRVAKERKAVVSEQDAFISRLGIPANVTDRYAALLRL